MNNEILGSYYGQDYVFYIYETKNIIRVVRMIDSAFTDIELREDILYWLREFGDLHPVDEQKNIDELAKKFFNKVKSSAN